MDSYLTGNWTEFAENDDVLVLCFTVTSCEHDGNMNSIDDAMMKDWEDDVRKQAEDTIKLFKDNLGRARCLDSLLPQPGMSRVDKLHEKLREERRKQLESNHRQVRGEIQSAPSAAIDRRRAEVSSSSSGDNGLPDGHDNIQSLDKVADDAQVSQQTRKLYVRNVMTLMHLELL
jgi:hypothetical protein